MKKYLTILFVLLVAYSFGAEHSKKLKYRKNTTTTEIKLYTTTAEVGDDRIALRDGSTTVYAKLGAVGDSLQSDLRIRDGLTTKSILLSASPQPYLVVAGEFGTVTGGYSAWGVAKYDGSIWSSLASSSQFNFNRFYGLSIATDGNNIYVGGKFGTPGLNSAYSSGTSWLSMGSGLGTSTDIVYGMHSGQKTGYIYYAGSFTTASGSSSNHIAAWNPSTGAWVTYLNGNGGYAIAEDSQGNFYSGGTFTTAGGMTSVNNIVKYDPGLATWTKLGNGVNNTVSCIYCDGDDNIYVGGLFTAVGSVSRGIAMWKPSTGQWESLGSGLAVAGTVVVTGIKKNPTNGLIYVCGNFTSAGGVAGFNNVAAWNPTSKTWSKLGTGVDSQCHGELDIDDAGNVYFGGDFTVVNGVSGYSRVAKWTPSTSTWTNIGGANGRVHGVKWVKPTQ